jgi:hypothetical protein
MGRLGYSTVLFLLIVNEGSLIFNLCNDLYWDGQLTSFSYPLLFLTLLYSGVYICYVLTRNVHLSTK